MDTSLPPNAMPAWWAYSAMGVTKQQHFEYLRHLEAKYEKYGAPSADEAARLAALLEEHDAQVNAFKAAVQELKASDAKAYAALIARLAGDGARRD